MSDLVTRLRASVRMGANDGNGVERMVCGKQMLEAADEIERLRALLREAREQMMNPACSRVWSELGWEPLIDRIDAAIRKGQR